MKKCLLFVLLHCCFCATSQTKLNFSYDGAGNQISRILCINCLSKSANQVKEIEAITNDDLLKFSQQDVISYYPNPVKEELYLHWELINDNYVTAVQVFAVTGQLLRSFQVSDSANNLNIPFQSYPSGMYLVLLSYKDGSDKSIKIIKQ